MKRYVKASFDSSMPDWLKADREALDYLDLDQRVDLQNATFSKTPTNFSRPIYLMNDGQSEFIYIPAPDTYGDYAYNSNHKVIDPKDGKRKAAKYLAKKTLPDSPLIVDKCYFETGSKWKNNEWEQRQEDVDPRYEKDRVFHSNHPRYQGQYQNKAGAWVDNTKYGYDKSGYKVASGKERLTKFYTSDKGFDKFVARYNKVNSELSKIKSKLSTLNPFQLDVLCPERRFPSEANDPINLYGFYKSIEKDLQEVGEAIDRDNIYDLYVKNLFGVEEDIALMQELIRRNNL